MTQFLVEKWSGVIGRLHCINKEPLEKACSLGTERILWKVLVSLILRSRENATYMYQSIPV